MNAKLLLGVVVILAGGGLGWYVIKGGTPSTTAPAPVTEVTTVAPSPETTPNESTSGETTTAAKVTVTYTDTGFAPNTITVKKGTTVHFVNNSTTSMWVASDVHPTHQLLPGFDELAQVSKGSAYDYTFVKVGTWTYHNHMNPTDKGTVVVTE